MQRRKFVMAGFTALAGVISGCLSQTDSEFGLELDDVEMEPGDETSVEFNAASITSIGIDQDYRPPSVLQVGFDEFDPEYDLTNESAAWSYEWEEAADVTGNLQISADQDITPDSYEVGVWVNDQHEEISETELFDIVLQ